MEIDIADIKDFSYYIKKEVSLVSIEDINSILLSNDLKAEKKSFITGLAVIT